MDIAKIDTNLATRTTDANGFIFYDVHSAPISLEGLAWKEENKGAFYRLPPDLAPPDIHPNEMLLAHHMSGVCVRFRSDSPQIIIRAKLAYNTDTNQIRPGALKGFDTYRRLPDGPLLHNRTLAPNYGAIDVCAECGRNYDGALCEWLVNCPSYCGLESLEIGIAEGSQILQPTPHRIAEPIIFYGSSITQGACATRPGNAYTSMLCRALDAEQVNLGFSGNAIGEPAIARAIASRRLSAFVLDYDHNASGPEDLAKTHEAFFHIVREAHPSIPIIIISMCDIRTFVLHTGKTTAYERREVIRQTYQHARDNGDKNVFFIDGETLFGDDDFDACSVDGCHPNDLGFYRMYKRILPVMQKALNN